MEYQVGSDKRTAKIARDLFDRIAQIASERRGEDAEALLMDAYNAQNRPLRAEFRALLGE